MNFFFDNNLSPMLAQAMNLLEQRGNVIHLTEIFPPDAKDEEWLEYVGQKRMIVVTRDRWVRRRAAELRAFKNYKVRAFILGGKNPGIWQIIRQVINNWLNIKDIASRTKPPFAFQVPLKGRIIRLPL